MIQPVSDMRAIGGVLAGGDISPIRVVAALALCLLMSIVAVILMRRIRMPLFISSRTVDKRIQVLDTVRLNSKTTLHLIQSGDAQILIACDSNGARTLHSATSKQETQP
ncbi:flagellar biosynthetic protein FliO [Caballeronia telluris]|uniref:Flagellar biosynthesis protein, FliO n=1 Tax=Caballeronia telluris TaxID=326475 RepID=A0A158ESV5_9BURK|nr:flagellar biosynthetic protein FliO [Caballeronia telluris]SAL10596.1 hypothetical protein AWB66_00211 [Caballeronia telluris]